MELRLLLFLLIPAFAFSQNIRHIGSSTGAACYEITHHNNYLYAGTGSTFRVYDANPATPPYAMTFEYRFRSNIDDIVVSGNHLYIAANHDGISKWDITNPAQPVYLYGYVPDSLNEAAADIAFFGDSLFVAMESKVVVFHDNGSSFNRVGDFGWFDKTIFDMGWIRGGEIRDSLYIYASGYRYNNNGDGVYITDARTFQQYSYVPSLYDGEDVIQTGADDVVFVLGGGRWTDPFYLDQFDTKGIVYALRVSDPQNPQLIFSDTLRGSAFPFPRSFAPAAPLNAVNVNDTIYVATISALIPGWTVLDSAKAHVYVYDATDTANIQRLTSIHQGLWHFDVAVQQQKLHVASEWYGIVTIDISDVFNTSETGRTLTGGWNISSDIDGNTMIVGNEGYGFKKFDIGNPYQPVLADTNQKPGFCMQVNISDNSQYLYANYLTIVEFRTFDLNTLNELGTIPLPPLTVNHWVGKSRTSGNFVVTGSDTKDSIKVYDVSNPAAPAAAHVFHAKWNDFAIDGNGVIFIANNDSLAAFDLNNGFQHLMTIQAAALQDFSKLAVYKDTVWSYVKGKGLTRYAFNFAGSSSTLTENASGLTAVPNPVAMAADSFGVYLGYTENYLYAYDRNNLSQLDTFRTGLGFIYPATFGVQDLKCTEGKIVMVEYFGQTSLLTMDPNFPVTINGQAGVEYGWKLYPNPVSAGEWLTLRNETDVIPDAGGVVVEIYDLQGRRMPARVEVYPHELRILPEVTQAGVYFWSAAGIGSGKFIVR